MYIILSTQTNLWHHDQRSTLSGLDEIISYQGPVPRGDLTAKMVVLLLQRYWLRAILALRWGVVWIWTCSQAEIQWDILCPTRAWRKLCAGLFNVLILNNQDDGLFTNHRSIVPRLEHVRVWTADNLTVMRDLHNYTGSQFQKHTTSTAFHFLVNFIPYSSKN